MNEPQYIESDIPGGVEPIAVMSTGFASYEAATSLSVYHVGGNTYVSTTGEHQNASPYRYKGIYEPATVLQWYRATFLEARE